MARWKVIEQKLKAYGKDITFSDAITLLEHYGYVQDNKGKTSIRVLNYLDFIT